MERETLLNLIYALKFAQMEGTWALSLVTMETYTTVMDAMHFVLLNLDMPALEVTLTPPILAQKTAGTISILEFYRVMMEILRTWMDVIVVVR